MKAKLEFKLPEEKVEFSYAVNGHKWSLVAWNVDQELRSKIKHSESLTDDQRGIYQEVRDMIREFMLEQNIDWE